MRAIFLAVAAACLATTQAFVPAPLSTSPAFSPRLRIPCRSNSGHTPASMLLYHHSYLHWITSLLLEVDPLLASLCCVWDSLLVSPILLWRLCYTMTDRLPSASRTVSGGAGSCDWVGNTAAWAGGDMGVIGLSLKPTLGVLLVILCWRLSRVVLCCVVLCLCRCVPPPCR